MSVSQITIYNTKITPERNALVDDIEDYLKTTKISYSSDNFQYLKFDLDLTIKINAPQNIDKNKSIGNYVRIVQDGKIWYYFIMNSEWKSASTIQLTLSIDSINTFRSDLHWNEKTSIVRQHMNRWKKQADTWTAIVDKEEEDFTPAKVITTREEIQPDGPSWYLMYRNREDISPDNLKNPVDCFTFADTPIQYYKEGGESARLITASDLVFDSYEYVLGSDNPKASVAATLEKGGKVVNITIGDKIYWHLTKQQGTTLINKYIEYEVVNFMFFKASATAIGLKVNVKYLREVASVPSEVFLYTFIQGNFPDYQNQEYLSNTCSQVNIINLNIARISSDANVPMEYANIIITTTKTYSIGMELIYYLQTIKDIDKTDAKILKIIKLPYAPSSFTFDAKGNLQYGSEWTVSESKLKLTDGALGTKFLNQFVGSISFNQFINDNPPTGNLLSHVRNDALETKFLNSQFTTYKFVYDSFSKEIKLENFFDVINEVPTVGIEFKPTNTINSHFAFKFNTGDEYLQDEDFGEYLLVNRNNEETIFSSDYINYIRTGYNYDKKKANYELGISIASGLLGGARITGIAGLGALVPDSGGGKSVGKGAAANVRFRRRIGAGALTSLSGFASNLLSSISNYVQAQATIEQKQNELKQQSVSVAGADDIDLLDYYSDNKLIYFVYSTREEAKKLIADVFYYLGYKHVKMELPNITSRVRFNFIQCTPVFDEEVDTPYHDYIADIKSRYENGVTVYHHVNKTWNWTQDKENYETEVIENV